LGERCILKVERTYIPGIKKRPGGPVRLRDSENKKKDKLGVKKIRKVKELTTEGVRGEGTRGTREQKNSIGTKRYPRKMSKCTRGEKGLE